MNMNHIWNLERNKYDPQSYLGTEDGTAAEVNLLNYTPLKGIGLRKDQVLKKHLMLSSPWTRSQDTILKEI